ncbi:MAG TPA: MBG domain-containing protein [Thermoanaerobaculia bacterium]
MRRLVLAVLLALAPAMFGASSYSTGFEPPTFALGDVSGQDGWGHLSNSPTKGIVEVVPSGTPGGLGTQSLAIRTNNKDFFGVANHLFSPTIDPAGETGSTIGATVVASPNTTFVATLWYRTPDSAPISHYDDGRIAELDPSSKGTSDPANDAANRYAQVRVINSTNTLAGEPILQMRWYLSTGLTSTDIATLEWGTWYRLEYHIVLVDGTNGTEPNDRVRIVAYDAAGNVIGSACGSTWELRWRSGFFDQRPTARAINGFDFWSVVDTNDAVAGYIDELSMSTSTPNATALGATIAGSNNVCSNGTTTLTANDSGGSGSIVTYAWRNASNTLVGSGATLAAGAGTYTVAITDSLCEQATSSSFTVTAYDPLTASIGGTTNVCYGETTTLSASSSGGSGSISGYTWRDGSNAIVGTASTLVAGAGTYTVTVTDASCGDATSQPVTVQATCKATPIVSWSDPADITYGTPLGATQLNATANVPGTFTYAPAAGTILNAGANQPLTVDFTPDDTTNYNSVDDTTVHINVLQATPIVTVSGGPFPYDGASHTATAEARDANGNLVSGSFTFTYDGSATPPVNAGTYAVVATFTSSDPNFANATGNGSLTINAATPVLTVSGGPFAYDGASHTATAEARDANSNLVSGSFTFTYDGSATAPVNAGTYAVVATFTSSDPNFANATGNGSLTINKATPIVTVSGGPFTYDGNAHSATAEARDANGNLVSGSFTFSYDGSAAVPANAGTYAVVATFTSSDPNFANATGDGSLTIDKATPVITWSDPADIVYGTPLGATQLNAGANVAGTFTYAPPAGTVLDAGNDQPLTANFAPNDSANYNSVSGTTVHIDVLPATPIITISGGPYTYDGNPHGVTATARDANGNTVSGTFAITYDGSSTAPTAPGTYNVVANFTSSDPNFTSATGNGTLTIQKAPTTITITTIHPEPSSPGEQVVISFHLGGIAGTPSGSVTITDGTTSCNAPATSTSCVMTFATSGPRTLTATYSGDANHLGSSTTSSHQVGEARANASLDDTTATICSGSSVTLRVVLTGTAPFQLTWSDGFVETVSEPGPHLRSVAPSQSTTYGLVSLSDANGPGDVGGAAIITVNSVARPSISGNTAEPGKPVTLRATSGYDSYQWFHDGAPISGATSDTLTIAAAAQTDLGSYTVTAVRNGCTSAASAAYTLVFLNAPDEADAIIPVVGNARGASGSLFRTTVHLTNATDQAIDGELTFLDASVQRAPFHLAPGETRFLDQLFPSTYNGVTSANVRRLSGPRPIVLAHVFNDGDGTSGLLERAVAPEAVLRAGDVAVLVAPIAPPKTTRFNIGLRSRSDGLSVRITRRSAAGALLDVVEQTIAPSTLIHDSAQHLLGSEPSSSESLTFEVLAGSGVIYGAATDNGTNDPNLQLASEVLPSVGARRFILPVAGRTNGQFDSLFATGIQLHNPSDDPMHVTFTFNGKQLTTTVEPLATLAMADVVASLGTTGFGSLEIVTAGTARPIVLARVYSIAAAGETSLMTELVPEEEVLHAGEDGVVVAPHAPQSLRFNLGLRTLAFTRITATVRNAAGAVLKTMPLSFDADTFTHTSAALLLDMPFTGDESIVFHLEEGAAAIYGVWTDNVTQDPALQYAVRP